MPLYTVNGIVLRRIDFAETDRIVTLYARERGKISGIAKGARKPISRLAGATETLSHGRYQLATGKTLDVITQAEVKDSFPRIRGDLNRVANATYMAELVDKLVEEHEPNADLFDLLLSALYLMERPNDPEKIVHMFELQFVKLVGYEPTLDKCLSCGKPPADDVFFSASLGGVVCRACPESVGECGPLPEDAIQISRETSVTMQKLLAADAPEVERMEIPREVMDQIARVMKWHIRYRAERELKSLEFLQALRVGTAGRNGQEA